MSPIGSKIVDTLNTVDTTLVTTTETVVASVSGVTTGPTRDRVKLDGWASLLTGAGTTAVIARIRRGTDATGVLVSEAASYDVGAAATTERNVRAKDTPGDGAFAYVLTIQQTGASGNGTVTRAALSAEVH